MINRRSLFGVFAVLLPTPAFARAFINDGECIENIPCYERGNIVYTYNKIGLPVSYTRELAADLWALHGQDAMKLFHNMYGTNFIIERKNVQYKGQNWIKYSRFTNDSRDKPYIWYVRAYV